MKSSKSRSIRRWVLNVSAGLGLLMLIGCGGSRPASPSSNASGKPATVKPASAVPLNEASPIRWRDRTSESGVEFVYRNGEEAGHFAILESLGGGVAALDYDGDGVDDLYFPGGGGFGEERVIVGLPGGLFRNAGSWRFTTVTSAAGLNEPRTYSHGAAAADFDNDGFVDLLITGYGGLQLWQNNGDGTFQERTDLASLTDKLWSSSAGWGDVNGDGALDLYIAHYVDWSFENHPLCQGPKVGLREVCPPRTFSPLPDVLYLSNGDGTFRDATAEWGLSPEGKGLGVILADLDLDGDLDVYVANDTVENLLYENVDGRLKDVSLLSGASLSERGVPDGSMGVDLFDYNRDGRPDLWVVNYERESCALYENSGQLMFRHVSQRTGITSAGGLFVSWGTCCFDADRDGDEDMFVSNGHVIRYPTNAPLRQHPLLFENLGGTRFRNVAATAGEYLATPHMGRGVVTADFDGDGRLDLVVSHVNEPAAVLSNETPPRGDWLAVDLIGTRSPRDAIGAVVVLTTDRERQVRQWRGGGSYASTSTRRLHFGLGEATAIEQVEIHWPSGEHQTIAPQTSNQVLRVIEPRRAEP
jgi:enediyne biosynthesis protein E4